MFKIVNDKLTWMTEGKSSLRHHYNESESIYCFEVLLECMRYLNARNIRAEDKY